MDLAAAVDLSTDEGAFAVAEPTGRKVLFARYQAMPGRAAAGLLPWLIETLAEHRLTLADIGEWTVGTGPGSFTGLRLAAALVLGFGFGGGRTRIRGLPSALGLALEAGFPAVGEVAVVYGGWRGEIIILTFTANQDQSGPGWTMDRKICVGTELEKLDATRLPILLALEVQREPLTRAVSAALSGKIRFFPRLPIKNLLFADYSNWARGTVANPEYIRPGVYIEPMTIRDVV